MAKEQKEKKTYLANKHKRMINIISDERATDIILHHLTGND